MLSGEPDARLSPTAQTWPTLLSSAATPEERARARATLAAVFGPTYLQANAQLLSLSAQEARAGAKIIVWPEGGAGVLQEDEAAFLARASALARTTGVYLDMGMLVVLQQAGPAHLFLDQIVLINPRGAIVWRYETIHLVPGIESADTVAGINQVPYVQTPYGRIANVVCFDGAYPTTLRQAGQAGADILLAPSNDWQLTDPIDTQVAVFRAIENGYSLVRQASRGLAMTTDYEGNVLAATDYFTTSQQVMVASVPTEGVRTIYAAIGDLFAWLSLLGLFALVGIAIARSEKSRAAGVAAPTSSSAVVLPEHSPVESDTASPRN